MDSDSQVVWAGHHSDSRVEARRSAGIDGTGHIVESQSQCGH